MNEKIAIAYKYLNALIKSLQIAMLTIFLELQFKKHSITQNKNWN